MVNTKQKRVKTTAKSRLATTARASRERMFESDGTYFLKLVVFILLATFWVKFSQPMIWLGVSIAAVPVGMLVGLLLVSQFEKHQSDRKIWYAILVVVCIISYFKPAGIVI